MGFCKRRFQFCQLLLRNNWKAVVKADLNYPAGNLDAVRKIGGNQNAVIDRRALHSPKECTRFQDISLRRKKTSRKIASITRKNNFKKSKNTSVPTWVKVVLCRRRAGVGQLAVVGVWPMWGLEAQGSGFNFLKAPSAPEEEERRI